MPDGYIALLLPLRVTESKEIVKEETDLWASLTRQANVVRVTTVYPPRALLARLGQLLVVQLEPFLVEDIGE